MSLFLVTGGCGFIGSHLVERLLAEGHRVRILDDLSTGKRENVPADVEVVVGNVSDAALVKKLSGDIDGCFHLAAIASVERCRLEPETTRAVNYGGTVSVVDAAKAFGFRVVFASSAAVYGDAKELPITEQTPTAPMSAYGQDKLESEQYGLAGGISFTALRFFNVYGERQDPRSPYSGVISIFTQRVREGKPVTLYGDGNQSRDFVYVKDVVECLYGAMGLLMNPRPSWAGVGGGGLLNNTQDTPPPQPSPTRGEGVVSVINICTGQDISLNALLDMLEDASGRKAERSYAPAREGDIYRSVGNPERVRKLLGLVTPGKLAVWLKKSFG